LERGWGEAVKSEDAAICYLASLLWRGIGVGRLKSEDDDICYLAPLLLERGLGVRLLKSADLLFSLSLLERGWGEAFIFT